MLRHLFTAMQHSLLTDPADTVHFHAGEGQPEVCYDAHCRSPRLDLS